MNNHTGKNSGWPICWQNADRGVYPPSVRQDETLPDTGRVLRRRPSHDQPLQVTL